MTQLNPDAQWYRTPNKKGLLAGSPMNYFTVSDNGIAILDAIENNTALPHNHESLTNRLIATGAAHPQLGESLQASDVTVVIPAYVTSATQIDSLTHLVDLCRGLRVIVVDDCSSLPISVPGAEIIRHTTNKGPGAARNTGLAATTTPYIAFIDSDATASTEQLLLLGSLLRRDDVALVAPRIVSNKGRRFLDEYEQFHCPLDMGTKQALVQPMSRVSYVPATVLVAKSDALRAINGFNETLRLGEDVDLVWRLVDNGLACAYEPSIQCVHQRRPTVFSILKQRFSYGTSAAQLAQQHPRNATPFQANIFLFLAALLILSGFVQYVVIVVLPAIAVGVWSLRKTNLTMNRKLRLSARNILSTVKLLATAVRRTWWPPLLLLSMFSLRPGVILTLSFLGPLMFEMMRNKSKNPLFYFAMRLVDDATYAVGVWVGALGNRSWRCLLPIISVRRSSAR